MCFPFDHTENVQVLVLIYILDLLQMLSYVYPGAFQSEDVFLQLIAFVKHDDDIACKLTLSLLM